MADHAALRILASQQHGVVSRRQIADLGFSRDAVASAVASGRWERISHRVVRLAGSTSTLQQRSVAACLDIPGGAIARQSAAAMWRIPGFTVEPLHVLTHRRPHRGGSRLGIAHSTTSWEPADGLVLDGIPVTSPLRTLRDLAGRTPPGRLSDACDRMLATGLLRLPQLHALGADLPDRDLTPAIKALRHLVGARPPGYRPPESNLERRFESILRDAGESPFERQVDLGDGESWIGRVDFLDRHHRIVVEIQSDLFHSGLTDKARDQVRIARLRSAGWIVVEVTEHEVWHRKDLVLAKIRSARATALHRCGSHRRP